MKLSGIKAYFLAVADCLLFMAAAAEVCPELRVPKLGLLDKDCARGGSCGRGCNCGYCGIGTRVGKWDDTASLLPTVEEILPSLPLLPFLEF